MGILEGIVGSPMTWFAVLAIETFILFYCKDVVKLKLALLLNKKKGAKFVIGINNDKSVKISAETPEDRKKFVFTNPAGVKMEIPITPNRLFYAPQFGVQCAMLMQGSKTMFDPFADKMIDPIDGEYMDVAIKKAKMVGEVGAGWFQSKEQKMLILLILLAVGGLIFGFLNMSQGQELVKMLAANQAALLEAFNQVPKQL